MHKRTVFWMVGVWATVVACVVACDDDVLTAVDAQPVLSADTLQMGTTLADVSTQTYQLLVYNPNDGDLKLSSVSLRGGDASGFRMNVDGMSGTSIADADLLHIGSGDSLYVFVEATFPPAADGGEQEYLDYIDVVCNGRQQSVVLAATCRSVATRRSLVVTADTTLGPAAELHVLDSLVVASGATLTLAAGTTIYMHDKADITVYGRLLATGTVDAPVTVRGDRMDRMFPNLAYDQLPSQWGRLYVAPTAAGNRWEHADVHGMTAGITVDGSDVELTACRVASAGGDLLCVSRGRLRAVGCEFSQAGGALLRAVGSQTEVVHCTLANYNFAARVTSPAVVLEPSDDSRIADGRADLPAADTATFVNTIVWGRAYEPDVTIGAGCAVRFDHCLLRADGADDDDFRATLWNVDPQFRRIDDADYTYDFHLQPESPAAAAGDSMGVALSPLDLDGNPRRNDVPSMGCYQVVAPD